MLYEPKNDFPRKAAEEKESMWTIIAAVNLVNLQQTLQYVSVSSYSDLRQYGSFIDCTETSGGGL